MPRTHNLRMLLNSVGELLGAGEDFREFIKRNRYKLHTLEDAYYSARYLPKVFSKDDAEELVEFAGEVIEFVRSHKADRASGKR